MMIGIVGLGAMGLPIAKRLLDAGYALKAFDTAAKAAAAAGEAGASLVDTAAEAARGVELLLMSLPNAAVVQKVLEEALPSCAAGMVIADLSSIAPESARSFAGLAAEYGVTYLDCPVSGGVGGASAGTLTVMVGGQREALEHVRPVLESFGKNIYHVGDSGSGSGVKMINNYLMGCNMAAAAEALVLGNKIGLELDTMYNIIQSSSGRSFIVENKIPNFIKKRSFDGGFAVDLEYKDLGLAVESAKKLNMPIPMGSMAVQVFEMARAKGYGKEDVTALLKVWEELMDTEVV